MVTCRLATIIVGCCLLIVVQARHVKLAATRQPPAAAGAGARSRVLVIRAPEGSGQPNRIIVLSTPQRTVNTPPPKDPSKTANTSSTVAKLAGAVQSLASHTADFDRNFGGHPQSAIREAAAAAAAATAARSTSQPQGNANNSTGTRSLRELIEGRRSQRTQQPSSNIVGLSPTVPRAVPPIQPTEKRFGELNIPPILEAALRRLQERARVPSNVRDRPTTTAHGQVTDPWDGPLPLERSPFHGGMIDLSGVRAPDHSHEPNHTHFGHRDTPGRERPASAALVPPETWDGKGQAIDTQRPAVSNNDLLRMNADFQFSGGQEQRGKTGSNLRTFTDTAHSHGHGHGHGHDHGHMSATPSSSLPADIQSLFDRFNIGSLDALSARLNSLTTQAPFASSVVADASAAASSSASSSSSSSSSNSGVAAEISPAVNPGIDVHAYAHDAPSPVAVLDASATMAKSSANTNSSTNTTSTKSVKTTSIKVTTVVKGGTAADVAAAAASQAEIAQAVAQGKAEGKELNSSSIADIAAKANSKIGANSSGNDASLIAPESNLPVGSITVKRQKNGESIITLNDGQGQPVVLRANGPVQIERIVKPDGKIQFLINPVKPKPQSSTINPADMEIEPEEMFTTTMASMIISDPNPSTTVATQSPDASFQDAVALTSVAADLGLIDKSPSLTEALVTNALLQTPTGPAVAQTTTAPPAVGPKAEKGAIVSKTVTGSGDNVSKTAASSGIVQHSGNSGSVPNIASLKQQAINDVSQNPSNNQNNAKINDLFTGLFPDLGSGLFSLFESPRIPPPPRIAGPHIGNRGVLNPFVSDTNLFNVNKDIGLLRPSQLPPVVNQSPLSTMAPSTGGNVAAGTVELNPNPPYNLLDVVPSVTRR